MVRGATVAAVAFAGAAAVAIVVGGRDDESGSSEPRISKREGVTGAAEPSTGAPSSPFAASDDGIAPTIDGETVDEPNGTTAARTAIERSAVAPLEGAIDVSALGNDSLDDDAFEALAARLATDPELLAAVIDEFRSETDPARLTRLVRLLGEVGGPEATALAAELVYSSDETLREVGLDLLRRVQPGNGEARDIVAGLLSNGTDRETLMPVLQTLTRPGVVPSDERTRLAAQVSLLSAHEDPAVRRLGLDVLSRWSKGAENTMTMQAALADAHPGVREAAAYALVGRPDADGSLTGELFVVAGNPDEEERVRRAAVLALKNLPLDASELERRVAIERELDRRP